MEVGRIEELWRYPVKSLAGERVPVLDLERRGALGDRLWAVRDEEAGALTSAKKLPALLMLGARFVREPLPGEAPDSVPHVTIRFPDGSELRSDDAQLDARLSAHVGRRVRLVPLAPAREAAHYRARPINARELRQIFGLGDDEPLPDFSMLPLGMLVELGRFATPRGSYFDCYPLHILTTDSLRSMQELSPQSDFDVRRFRPNLLIATDAGLQQPEGAWCGGSLRTGSARLGVEAPTVRCSMPSRNQPGMPADPTVMKTIARHAERCFGAYASIAKAGRVQVGDRVELELPSHARLHELARASRTRARRILLAAAARLLPKG